MDSGPLLTGLLIVITSVEVPAFAQTTSPTITIRPGASGIIEFDLSNGANADGPLTGVQLYQLAVSNYILPAASQVSVINIDPGQTGALFFNFVAADVPDATVTSVFGPIMTNEQVDPDPSVYNTTVNFPIEPWPFFDGSAV
jgi:hypothetical protein